MACRRPPPPCVPTGLSLVCPCPRLLLLQGQIGLGPRVASFTLIISYRPVSDYSHLAGSWRLGQQHINSGDTASGKTPSHLATCPRMGAGVFPSGCVGSAAVSVCVHVSVGGSVRFSRCRPGLRRGAAWKIREVDTRHELRTVLGMS